MNAEYVAGVRKFGGPLPYRKENGGQLHLQHQTQFAPVEVETDRGGNITQMPLLLRKPCFGRPERYIRGCLKVGAEYGDADDQGARARGRTQCGRCPVALACGKVAFERIDSAPAISKALTAWIDANDARKLDGSRPLSFYGELRRLWDAFLQAVIDHGGWSSFNDDNVRLHEVRKAKDDRRKHNEARRRRTARRRAAYSGTAKPLTVDYFNALQVERDSRARHLKQLRVSAKKDPWLFKLPPERCDRIADVWQGREMLTRAAQKSTGVAIAKWMVREGRNYGLAERSLVSRVCDDLKRIAKLETDFGSGPLWPKWVY
jgi:hypothetical protein